MKQETQRGIVPENARDFVNAFHSFGEEPWVAAIIKNRTIDRVLDLGCGLGTWGHLLRTFLTPKAIIIGLDISENKINILRHLKIYDKLIIGDATKTQVADSFDLILMGEILHEIGDPAQLLNLFEGKLNLQGVIIIMGPSNKSLRALLGSRNYQVYEYYLRGFFLVNYKNGKIVYMRKTRLFSFAGNLLKIAHPILGKQKRHIIAYKENSLA